MAEFTVNPVDYCWNKFPPFFTKKVEVYSDYLVIYLVARDYEVVKQLIGGKTLIIILLKYVLFTLIDKI